ncbi:MAG: PKD domain-containing protein [Thermoplasmatota archaeon]
MRLPALILAAALLTLCALSAPPAGADKGPPEFSCALRLLEDGGLVPTPVDFPLPALSRMEERGLTSSRGPYCDIINSSGRVIPYETVRSLEENFTLVIWPNDTAAFGTPPYSKINIIIVSHDGVGGVAGYFSSGDPDAIYLDYDDLHVDLDVTAHEFQHLIHYSKDPGEATWVNEGCSECGIYVCYGGGRPGLTGHFAAYGSDTDNSFIDWDTVSDYGSAALFTIYCHEHFGGDAFTRSLVSEPLDGVQGYNSQLSPKGESFESVFKKWVVANWLNNASVDGGEWGYRGVYNYVGHTFLHKDYPLTCSSQVEQRWGADYIRFEPTIWNQLMGDLEINITFTAGSGHCAAALVGKTGSGAPDMVEVPTLSGGRATLLVPNLGGDFAVAGVAISGLSSPASYTYEARVVDKTPPVTRISVVPGAPNGKNGYYTSLPSISLSTSEPRCTTHYRWDAGPYTTYSIPFKPPEGNHTLIYHSVDAAGNVEPDRSRVFLVDTVAPVTSATLEPPEPSGQNGWYNSSARVVLSCDTPEAEVRWSWDNDFFSRYTGPVELAEGVHRFNYRAEDTAGNLEVVRTLETRLDTTPPTVECLVRPEAPDGQAGWYVRTPWVNLSCSDPAEPRIYYRWDDGPLEQYVRDLRAPQGAHTLAFYAVDAAGNRGPFSSIQLRVDGSPPGVDCLPEVPEPDGLSGWYVTPINVSLVANETGNVTIYYEWDGRAQVQYGGPFPVPEGTHTLSWYGVDEAGNRGPEGRRDFRLDSAPPVTLVSVEPGGVGTGWYHVRPRVTLSSEPNATIAYSLDGGKEQRYYRPIEIPEGQHSLSFHSTDGAGNIERRAERVFRVDTTPPRIVALNLSSRRATTRDYVTINVLAEDENGVQALLYDFGDGTTSGWTEETNLSRRYPYPGNYVLKVRVRDGSGLEATSAELQLNVTLPPTSPPPATLSLGDALSSVPTAVYYIIGAALILAVVGVFARRALRKRRRMRLYKEVERAEEERERRHTMELDELEASGLRREASYDPFGPPAPASQPTAYTYDIAPGGAVVRWEETPGPAGEPSPEASYAPDFGGVKLWGWREGQGNRQSPGAGVPGAPAPGGAAGANRAPAATQRAPSARAEEAIPEVAAEPIAEEAPVRAAARAPGPAWVRVEERRPRMASPRDVQRPRPGPVHGPQRASGGGAGVDELEAVLRRIRGGE